MLSLNETHPANLQVLASLRSRGEKDLAPIALPESVKDPYMNCGSHPDVVERVWDQLGRTLPEDGRCLVFGSPALVHPKSGVILALCFGTAYCLRLPKGAASPSRQRLVQRWTGSSETDIESEIGTGWVFGDYSQGELDWLKEAYQEFC